MEIVSGHRALYRRLVRPAIAIGNFDGVHLGHQRLLAETVAAARRLQGEAVVFTFAPHPAKVLAPELAPPLITASRRKLELIEDSGIDVCIVEVFDSVLAALSPADFLHQVLVTALGARHVVVGYDFTYGHKRAGTTASLRQFGQSHGFQTQVIDPVTVDDIVASSTQVRQLVAAGDLAGARLVLGRPFDLDGVVIRGHGRGASLGIATANLATTAELLPPPGVYAVQSVVFADGGDSEALWGVANLGTKPTFGDGGALSLEVHVLDFTGDLYGRDMRVAFVERLRGERRFANPAQLVAQIHKDIARAREVLAATSGEHGQGASQT